MEETSDEDMWEEPEESPGKDVLEVDFYMEDIYDPLDDELFGGCRRECAFHSWGERTGRARRQVS